MGSTFYRRARTRLLLPLQLLHMVSKSRGYGCADVPMNSLDNGRDALHVVDQDYRLRLLPRNWNDRVRICSASLMPLTQRTEERTPKRGAVQRFGLLASSN